MAKFFKRDGFTRYPSSTVAGKSSARKYVAKAEVQDSGDMNNNDDFVVKAGSSLKKLSISAGSIAASIRDSIRDLNIAIDNNVGEGTDKGSSGTKFSDVDLNAYRKVTHENIVARLDIDDAAVTREVSKTVTGVLNSGISQSSFSKKIDVTSRVNKATPDIDYIEMILGDRGMNDRFTARVVFSVKTDALREEGLKAFRIFRAQINSSVKNPTLGVNGLNELVSPSAIKSRKRNDQSLLFASRRFSGNNVDSFISKTTTRDEMTGLIVGLTNTSKVSSDDFDDSVADDLNTLKNVRISSKASTDTSFIEALGKSVLNADTIRKLSDAHVLSLRNGAGDNSSLNVVKSNAINFKELSVVPFDKLKRRTLPGFTELSFFDDTVEYGKTYIYYVVSVDRDSVDSARSKLARFTVTNNVPPAPPSNVVVKNDSNFVTLSITQGSTKFPVEKYEIYRKDDTAQVVSTDSITTVSNNSGFILETNYRDPIKNGFVQISEVLNSKSGGAYCRDMTAVRGKKYTYRVYSVDIFGNKSHEPFEVEFLFNERNFRTTDLKKPTILTEIDATTNRVKVTIISTDKRIVGLFLGRRDLSLQQEAFTVPSQPSHVKLGNKLNSKFFEDTVIRTKESSWTGYFDNIVDVPIIFVDQTTRVDHTYQYSVYGVDRFGNKTSTSISQALFVSLRPKVNEPINLSAKKQIVDGAINVNLTWDDGDIDVEAEEKLGNREDLENSSVRTLYQVERKQANSETWEQFPMTDKRELVDTSGKVGDTRQKYMPQFLKVDADYLYRVAAYQTGGFISNFTNPISVSTFFDVKAPVNFRVASPDTRVNPFYVVLNWDDDAETGTIDRWIIERAVVNSFAATRINISKNTLSSLKFEKFKTVYRESSRSVSRDLDNFFASQKDKLFTGQHYVVDDTVKFGNAYYYRIRSVGLSSKNTSNSVIKGILVTDALFDSKLNGVLTQGERNKLSETLTPLVIRKKLLRSHE